MQETRQGSVTLVWVVFAAARAVTRSNLPAQSRRVVFVATAKISDEEMRAKIERHRADRPEHWTTVEEPLDLAKVLAQQQPDCDAHRGGLPHALYVANLLEAEGENDEAIAPPDRGAV